MDGARRAQVELVLAADILPYSNNAALVANTIQSTLVEGGMAIVVSPDENHRFGVEAFPDACREVGLEVELSNSNLLDDVTFETSTKTEKDQGRLDSDLEKTAGYDNQGYTYHKLLMFTVQKPISTSG